MMPWWALTVLLLGANFALWGAIGLVRLAESGTRRSPPAAARDGELTVADVAVLIPAHNEALVIGESLRSIMALVPRQNVHVVSDGSTDATVQIARGAGARVIETKENVGKAGALQEAIERFGLVRRGWFSSRRVRFSLVQCRSLPLRLARPRHRQRRLRQPGGATRGPRGGWVRARRVPGR